MKTLKILQKKYVMQNNTKIMCFKIKSDSEEHHSYILVQYYDVITFLEFIEKLKYVGRVLSYALSCKCILQNKKISFLFE